jgi:hypothetical protein
MPMMHVPPANDKKLLSIGRNEMHKTFTLDESQSNCEETNQAQKNDGPAIRLPFRADVIRKDGRMQLAVCERTWTAMPNCGKEALELDWLLVPQSE